MEISNYEDELIDLCAYCLSTHEHVPATHFCRQCGSHGRYICESCRSEHLAKKHDVVGISDVDKKTSEPEVEEDVNESGAMQAAKRFSELYENEWSDVFNVLSNKRIDERTIITTLLRIAEDAYKYCKEEAEEQMKIINSAVVNILSYGKLHIWDTNPVKTDCHFLHEFRKSYGTLTVPRLQEHFFKTKLKNIYPQKLRGLETRGIPEFEKGGVMETYANKTVDIAWWLNIQDPPVYMCPTTSKSFDCSLYDAYTKPGKSPNFFVWPALKLSKDGELLTKGIVQYL